MRGWFDVRPPGGGLAFYVGFMIVISTVLIIFSITGKVNNPTIEWAATGMFVVGVGLWLKHSWARWVAFTFFALVTIGMFVRLFDQGVSAKGIIRLLIVLSTLYTLWEWNVWPAEETAYALDNDDLEAENAEIEDLDDEFDQVEKEEPEEMSPAGRASFWSMRS